MLFSGCRERGSRKGDQPSRTARITEPIARCGWTAGGRRRGQRRRAVDPDRTRTDRATLTGRWPEKESIPISRARAEALRRAHGPTRDRIARPSLYRVFTETESRTGGSVRFCPQQQGLARLSRLWGGAGRKNSLRPMRQAGSARWRRLAALATPNDPG